MNKKKAMLSDGLYHMMKAAFCMGVFYLVYCLFLKRETHFALNRFYLLGSALLSLFIPLIRVGLPAVPEGSGYSSILHAISVGSHIVEDTIPDHQATFQILLVIYLAGMIVFSFSLMMRILRLILIVKRFGCEESSGMKLVFLPYIIGSPFSFFHYIFISRDHYRSTSVSKILTHEKIHIAQHHSIDILLLEFILVLQWFNPFIWLYKRSIKHIHEYLADEGVIRKFHDMTTYQSVLLTFGSGIILNTLAHNFNHSLLKRRFIMMTKSKSLPHTRWKMVTIIPVIMLLLLVFSDATGSYLDRALSWDQPGKAIIGPLADISASKVSIQDPAGYQTMLMKPDSIFTVVEDAPMFKGGQDALIKYITQNITYPEQARKQGIQGTVYITFLIDEKGKVANGKVLRGIGSGCDEEALRVVMSMPNWDAGINKGVPVKVQFNLPIKFSLSESVKEDAGKDAKMDVGKDIDPE